ncbi:L,D-transpeptidase catalytic domain [Marinobacter mobilis]|uniref:L,D-transpeptidase catalytic domain n=1 Tax=Marinobacter mobilis TaxID=488533 RepID=A0A1H2YYS3_9GAMM|nr:L,D-transpeptidase catalytic domain [Marinobacter mobilis]
MAPDSCTRPRIDIDLSRQTLSLYLTDELQPRVYSVSTALNGPGEQQNSGCTPRGRHYIRACIGAGQPRDAVFVGRRPTGEVYSADLARAFPGRDWILTRILWLCGREWGLNRGPGVDSFRRFIYIHGTPDSEPMGTPRSHGCVRMRNRDLLELFDLVKPGTDVVIR